MLSKIATTDPWSQTVTLLSGASRSTAKRDALFNPKRSLAADNLADKCFVRVTIVERLSATRVAVKWRDLTSCCYGEQAWRSSLSRRAGTCALSGDPIDVGAAIYRPVARLTTRPINAGAMILAKAVGRALLGDE